ncbi:MAG: GNAT family N-acetyltransferase [Deltaproteobacteria bacterium]|nr:GNAT family N-acetyltransferase [Deltaproteobacteria bacterium]
MPELCPPLADDLSLRPLCEEDRGRICAWMQDLELTQFTVVVPGPNYAPVLNETTSDEYFTALLEDPRRQVWAICKNGLHVGNVGLRELDVKARRAECFVELGEASLKGQGIGTWAMRGLLVEVFFNLELHDLCLGVFEFNVAARKLYTRLGFSECGHYGWHYCDERFHEVLYMRLQKETYFALRDANEA